MTFIVLTAQEGLGYTLTPNPPHSAMRFKATIIPARFPSFWAHIQMMERVGKRAVLLFERSSVRMVVTSDTDTVMQYSHLHTAAVFESFRCESRSDNVIAIEVTVATLLAGLKPAGPGDQLTLKLTKREEAQYLRAETHPQGAKEGERTTLMVQDMPVRVIVGQEMLRYAPPALPTPRVCLFLPAPRLLCAVVDRMKALSKTLLIEATAPARAEEGQGGEEEGGSSSSSSSSSGSGSTPALLQGAKLALGVDNELARVRTMFNDLTCEAHTDTLAKAAVGIADFSRSLRGVAGIAATLALRVKLALLPPTALYISVTLEDGTGGMVIIHTIKDMGLMEEEEEEGGGGGGSGAAAAAAGAASAAAEFGGEEEEE